MGGRRGPNISGERKARLLEMAVKYYLEAGLNLDECAAVMGIGRTSVSNLLDEAGVERRPQGNANRRFDARRGLWIGRGRLRRRLDEPEARAFAAEAVKIYKRPDGTLELVAKELRISKENARALVELGGMPIRNRGWRHLGD